MAFNTLDWNRLRYNIWSPIYAPVIGPLFDRARRRGVKLLDLRQGERVLIVGAGPGLDLAYLPHGIRLTAIDAAPAMVRRLCERAKALQMPVDARVADAQALPFGDRSFDAAILFLIVAVVADPFRCAREVARVLRPGGRAVIFDKFAPDCGRVPLPLRVANPVARLIGTDVTRQLGPIVAGAGMQLEHEESAGLMGLLKIAVVRKD